MCPFPAVNEVLIVIIEESGCKMKNFEEFAFGISFKADYPSGKAFTNCRDLTLKFIEGRDKRVQRRKEKSMAFPIPSTILSSEAYTPTVSY